MADLQPLCIATTKDGKPCRNHSTKGSDLCRAHGGMAITNPHPIKHGFYRPIFNEDEYADLLTYAQDFDLADELAVARTRLRRIIKYIDRQEKSMDVEEYARLNQLVFSAIRVITDVVLKLDGGPVDHWTVVLNQLSQNLGMEL